MRHGHAMTGRLRRLALAAVLAVLAVGGIYLWSRPGHRSRRPTPHFDLPPLATSPYLNATAAATYVGLKACAECHADQYRTYRLTAHSLALADLDPKAEPPDGRFTHAASGRSYAIYRQGHELHHRESVRDPDGQEYATADYPIRYLVGSGRHTRSYLIEVDGFLGESPLTWYTARHTWGMSPGYDRRNHRGFERAADSSCLFCHVGRMTEPDENYQRLTIVEQPIGCERCHGPGSLHVAQERALRDGTAPAGSERTPTIVHPRQLPRSLGEAICAQCHLNGDSMVTLRGRSLNDFRPGLPLSDFCINYRLDEPNSRMKVVGHVEQLHLSRCYQASEKLTCVTCHDPHANTPPDRQRAHHIAVCKKCHADESCRLDHAERLRRNRAGDCVACHMPQVETEIPHIAFTHHRIGIHGADAKAHPAATPARLAELVPTDDVSHLSAIDRERNLALAYFGLYQRQTDPDAADAYRARAQQLLQGVYARGLPDGEVAAALARLWREDDPATAMRMAEEALHQDKLLPKTRVNCLFLLGEVGLRTRRIEAARQALEQLVTQRRLSQDWLLLAECRQQAGDLGEALHDLQQAAAIAPFRPEIHNALAQVHGRMGQGTLAQRERAIAASLQHQDTSPNR